MRTEVGSEVQGGLRPDFPGLALPDGLWTDSRNVRYRDASVEKVRGYEAVLGSLSATAIFCASISDGSNIFWAYAGNSVFYATDGTTHADITGMSLTFQASNDLGYTGGAFHGFLVVTDGAVIPQSWSPSLANDFVSLTAWPAATFCKVMRPFKDFLFALRVTSGGVYNPREIRWSDIAGAGALPGSWDYTDPANSAGRTELGQTQDLVVDALALRDSLMVYKEFHTWIADLIGGDDVFSFRQVFSQMGILAENCAASFGPQQFVVTDSDIVVHDGNNAKSIADQRMRRWFFNRLNTSRFKRTFVTADYRNREIFVCFPESGNDWPNLAIVWNWADDSWHVRELGGAISSGGVGLIPGQASTFDSDARLYAEATESFDEETYNPSALRVLLTDAVRPLAYQLDASEAFDGRAMTCYAERTGVGISNIDLNRVKRVKRIFPKIAGNPGDTLRFYVGIRSAIDAAVLWRGPYSFTIGQDYKLDLRLSGRFLDIKTEYVGPGTFRLFGFGIEYELDGTR